MTLSIVYGQGGYDPTKPNNNIIEEIEIPDEQVDTTIEKDQAIAKLESLGLTVEDIRLILGAE